MKTLLLFRVKQDCTMVQDTLQKACEGVGVECVFANSLQTFCDTFQNDGPFDLVVANPHLDTDRSAEIGQAVGTSSAQTQLFLMRDTDEDAPFDSSKASGYFIGYPNHVSLRRALQQNRLLAESL